MTRLFSVAILLVSFCSFAQVKYEASEVEKWVTTYTQFFSNIKGYPGYRVQIFFESGNYSKTKALGVKARFISLYPDIPVYVIYQEPYYRVRVGNFRSKLEAYAFKEKIKKDFAEAYVIKDRIDMPMIYRPADMLK